MSSKTFGLFALSIFAVLFVMGLASAVIVLNPSSPSATVAQGNSGSFTFTIENTDATSDYSNFSAVVSSFVSGSNTLAASNVVVGTLPTTLNAGNTSSPITVTINIPSNQANGTYTGTITIDADGSTTNPISQTLSVSINVTSGTVPSEVAACLTTGNPGQLDIKSIDFSNDGMQHITFGEDDEWFPFEEIEVEIEVENKGNDDIDDISVEWGIWDTRNNQWVIDLDEEDEINLKDDDEETLTLTFTIDDDMDVDLDELTDGDNYRFYVVATGTVDSTTSPETCVADFESSSIVIESDFVILDNFEVPESVQCGDTITITADAWNIGDNDQDDVSVFIENAELGLNEDISLGDIDAFDVQRLTLNFEVPSNADEKTYKIDFGVYDEDNDLFENDFDEDLSEVSIPLTISNCDGSSGGNGELSVTASIYSGGKAGQELVVEARITNNADEDKTYSLNIAGYEDWASSFSLDKNVLNLDAGESDTVRVTLDVANDASGSESFFIEFLSDGELTRQPVTVNVADSNGASGGITGFVTGDNWYLWGIGLLNIILVIVIIIVAVRIARK